jgi:hypothetical protein
LAVSEAIIGAIATGRGAIPVNHHAISSIVLDQ